MNKKASYIIGLVIFGLGFFAGMEYKAYQIKSVLKDAFSGITDNNNSSKATTVMEEAKKENLTTIDKAIGDEVSLATMKLLINKVDEKQTISSSYGSPKVATEGTKFAVVNLDVTNTTDSEFSLSPDFMVVDSQGREFSVYSDSIGSIDKYLNYRSLAPSIKETGVLVYQIPSDSTSYSMVIAKAGTKELYKILLK